MKVKLFLIFTILIFCYSCAFAMGEKQDIAWPDIGKQAPDFALKDLNGNEVKLSDQKGRVVLLNFFSLGCDPCVNEMPSMQRLHEKLAGKDFIIIAVNLDAGTDVKIIKRFAEENGYTFKIVLDEIGIAATKYKIRPIPATFIIDKKGMIANKIVGAMSWDDEAVVRELRKLF